MTKLKEIAKWLTENDRKHKYIKKDGVIIFATGDDEITQLHVIIKEKTSTHLAWYMHVLEDVDGGYDRENHMNLQDNIYKEMILEYVLRLNYQYKFGSWEYDYRDGDIRFYTSFPLEDTGITTKQFERLYKVMTNSGEEGAKGIKYITEHGEFPKESSELSALRELLKMIEGMKDDMIEADIV